MTYQSDFTLPTELLEQIAVEGFDVLPDLIRIIVNAAMQAPKTCLAVLQYDRRRIGALRARPEHWEEAKIVSPVITNSI